MPKKLTLLLISQTQLARAEVVVGKTADVKQVWSRERLAGESLPTLVDAAIRLTNKRPNDIWVLSTDFWSGVVHLASDVTSALDGEELEQAIGLEAETYSGISAFESRLGLKTLPADETGEARWWVTQIAQSDWQEVERTVKQAGGKLAGMGHAALAQYPERLLATDATADRGWRMCQCFGEATIALRGTGPEIKDVIALGDLATQRNRSQLLDWCDETAASGESMVWLLDQPMHEQVDCSNATVLSLSNANATANTDPLTMAPTHPPNMMSGEDALSVWAETMASCLRTDRDGDVTSIPVAMAQKAPMSNQTAILIACGLGLLLACACFGFHLLGSSKLAQLDKQIESLDAEKEKLATGRRAAVRTEQLLKEKRREMDALKSANQKLTNNLEKATRVRHNQQTRWLQLVSALSKSIEGDCWVRGLTTVGQEVKVQGLATSNRDIAVFTSNLERIASPHGWRVHPAKTVRNGSSLIEFEVSLDVTDREPTAADGPVVAGSSGLNSGFESMLTRSNSTTETSSPATNKSESNPK